MTVQITLPTLDTLVQQHHDLANEAIAAMSPSRSYDAETNINSWRRRLSIVDPAGSDGYAFPGNNLRPGTEATVPLGSVILVVDSSWAKANWYAGRYIPALERWATLYVAEQSGLQQVMTTRSRRWASEILGYLTTNPALCERGGISFGASPRR